MPPKSKKQQLTGHQLKVFLKDYLKELGNEALLNNDYTKAVEYYTQALGILHCQLAYEDNPIYYNNRSQAYFYQQEYELALLDCDKALDLQPDYKKAIANKAQILSDMGRSEVITYQSEEAIHFLKGVKYHNNQMATMLNSFEQNTNYETLKMSNLEQWLIEGKAQFHKLKIEHYSGENRGIHAKELIQAKELILFVPKTHLITLEASKETVVAKRILSNKLELISPKHSFLSTFLLQEKYKENSYWHNYLQILPKTYDTFPIFYKQSDLDWLVGSPFLKQVKEKLKDLRKDYQDICSVAPEFNHSFEDFCWARMTASSRIFGITIKGVKTDAFVPMADMLNHRRPKQTSWMYSDERQGFIIEADERIEPGQMIFDSYGRKCNSRFLLNYGFVMDDNDANEVDIHVQAENNDPLIEMKENMVMDGLLSRHFRVLEDTEESNVQEFMSFVRFLVLDDEDQVKRIQKSMNTFKPHKTPPISIQNEMDMWRRIKRIVNRQLSLYPTLLQNDYVILKEYVLSQNQRNCLQLRIGEKEILHFYDQMADKMLKVLVFSKRELNKFCCQTEHYRYQQYINRVIIPFS